MGHAFARMFEMEIVQQMGRSGTRLMHVVILWPIDTKADIAHRVNFPNVRSTFQKLRLGIARTE